MRLLMDHSLLQKQHWKLHNKTIIIGLKGSHLVAFFLASKNKKKKNLLFCLEMKKSFLYLLKKSETMNYSIFTKEAIKTTKKFISRDEMEFSYIVFTNFKVDIKEAVKIGMSTTIGTSGLQKR